IATCAAALRDELVPLGCPPIGSIPFFNDREWFRIVGHPLSPQNQGAGVLAQTTRVRTHEEFDVGNLPWATVAAQLAYRITSILPAYHVGLRKLSAIDIHREFAA